MAQSRLINCDFINDSFKTDISNRGKLLYIFLFANADNWGFCGKVRELIAILQKVEDDYENKALCDTNYENALQELIDKGLVYCFTNKHENKVILIRAWFIHNKYIKGLQTNYYQFAKLVELEDGEYHLKEKKSDTKEKESQNKTNKSKINKLNNEVVDNSDFLTRR